MWPTNILCEVEIDVIYKSFCIMFTTELVLECQLFKVKINS